MYHQPKNNKAHSSIYVATFQGAQALSNRPTETYCQPFIVYTSQGHFQSNLYKDKS